MHVVATGKGIKQRKICALDFVIMRATMPATTKENIEWNSLHFRCNAYRLHFPNSILFRHSSHFPLNTNKTYQMCLNKLFILFSDVERPKNTTTEIPDYNFQKCAVIFVKQQLKTNEEKEKCSTVCEVNRIMDFYSHKPKTEILTWFLWHAIINNPAKRTTLKSLTSLTASCVNTLTITITCSIEWNVNTMYK